MSDSALVVLQLTSRHERSRVAVDAGMPLALEQRNVRLASDCGEIRLSWESVGADWVAACRARSRA